MKSKKIVYLLGMVVMALACMMPVHHACAQTGVKDTLNPLNFGLRETRSAQELYDVLYKTHSEASIRNAFLSYKGIDTLNIDIPANAKSLPLPYETDFAGVVINVSNNSGTDVTLFTLSADAEAVTFEPTRAQIDDGDFTAFEALRSGDHLVVINDKNAWTTRIGYDYNSYRADLLYLHNGKSVNSVVASYKDTASAPSCRYISVNNRPKYIQNVTIHRIRNCSNKTYCFSVSYQNNVTIRNVLITTPKGKFIADRAIALSNSSNCTIQDVEVDSTYSVPGGYGYAISMGNVWNTTFVRFKSDAAWGVFGTNNVNTTTLRECDVNRFDIHCYGKDARFVNCTFRNKQTQFSSMYGTVEFDSCLFDDCIPVRIRSSYNAYTPFDVVIRHCTMNATLRYHALVNVMLLATEPNPRPELSPRCWPNVYVEDLTVNMPFLTRRVVVIDPTGTTSECKKPVDYIDKITINGLRTVRKGKPVQSEVMLSSRKFKTKAHVIKDLKNIEILKGRIVDLIEE